jgi:hypothetical protein
MDIEACVGCGDVRDCDSWAFHEVRCADSWCLYRELIRSTHSPDDLLLAYWLGRYHGFVDPEW